MSFSFKANYGWLHSLCFTHNVALVILFFLLFSWNRPSLLPAARVSLGSFGRADRPRDTAAGPLCHCYLFLRTSKYQDIYCVS